MSNAEQSIRGSLELRQEKAEALFNSGQVKKLHGDVFRVGNKEVNRVERTCKYIATQESCEDLFYHSEVPEFRCKHLRAADKLQARLNESTAARLSELRATPKERFKSTLDIKRIEAMEDLG